MTELEQIRKELNELRERVAVLEKLKTQPYVPMPFVQPNVVAPYNPQPPVVTTPDTQPPFWPRHFPITCGGPAQ